MITVDIAIVGAGPAGLMAALQAAQAGASVLLIERANHLGGQLIKQTHKFFGSKAEYAGERGIDIARLLIEMVQNNDKIAVWKNAVALGYYEDGVLTVQKDGQFCTMKPRKMIIASGAAEKALAFPNNDLPGIYGAGAVQTLMNVYGVMPGKRLLMVGAGNIGVIVAYQLLQAGVEVAGIVEAAPHIGAYWVHAAKVQRSGVPIYTSYTIKQAYGNNHLEGVTICQLDAQWQQIPGTEQDIAVDGLCLSVGLTPLTEILWQAGCKMKYVPELGGYVPWRNQNLCTSHPDIYIAGDAGGVEEASSAMVEGKLAGMHAAFALGYHSGEFTSSFQEAQEQLRALRSGPVGEKIRTGLAKVMLQEVI